jgi:hypothetical protein
MKSVDGLDDAAIAPSANGLSFRLDAARDQSPIVPVEFG